MTAQLNDEANLDQGAPNGWVKQARMAREQEAQTARNSTQTQIAVDPRREAALGAELMECIGAKIALRLRITELEAEIARLKAVLEAAQP